MAKTEKGYGRDAKITVHLCEHVDKPLFANGLCYRCYQNRYQKALYHKVKDSKPANYYKRIALLSKFGLTLEQYEEMLESQSGVCKICGKTEPTGRRLAVDHNHTTGKVRGLLCGVCNTRLSHIEGEFYPKALAYLKEYE